MIGPRSGLATSGDPVLRRLLSLAPLDDAAREALTLAMRRPRRIRARKEILVDGHNICETLMLVDGWAARSRVLEDGRRQIMNFTLPGDFIGLCDQQEPVASSTVIAVTDVVVCIAPERSVSPTLSHAFAMSRALEEAHLLHQITRLGRLSASERIEDMLLELLERLELAGLSSDGQFATPVTQEQFADSIGLTSIHVNRLLQQARHDGILSWRSGMVTLHDPEAMRSRLGRRPVRVSTRWPRTDGPGRDDKARAIYQS